MSCYTDLTDRDEARKNNLGFPRCVQDSHDGKLLISGHDDSARVWDMISGKLLWFIPFTLRSGQEKILQIIPSPTGYHFLYRTKSRLYWLDPRAYLISGTPVSSFSSRDMEWLELMKNQKIAVDWASFLLELQVFLSEHKHAIVFPQDLVFGKASDSNRSTDESFDFIGDPKPDHSDSWLYQLIPELESEQRSSLEDEIFNRLLSDSKSLLERIGNESTDE